jgi:hypothetical protein
MATRQCPPSGSALPALEGRYLVAQSGLFSRWLAKMRGAEERGEELEGEKAE